MMKEKTNIEESYFSLESAQLNSNLKNCTYLNNIFKVEIYSYTLNVYFRTNKKIKKVIISSDCYLVVSEAILSYQRTGITR